jgi:hypothetical protein
VLSGLSAVIEIIISYAHDHLSINPGILGLFIGPGLLRLRRGWRTLALVFLWLAMISAPLLAGLLLAVPGPPAQFKLFGQTVGNFPVPLAVGFVAGAFLLSFWQYRVLTRPDVRALFGVRND